MLKPGSLGAFRKCQADASLIFQKTAQHPCGFLMDVQTLRQQIGSWLFS